MSVGWSSNRRAPGLCQNCDGSNWTHYNLVQDLQGNVMSVVDKSGAVVERYEYDPYGNRRIYTPNGSGGWNEVYASTVENHYGYTGRRHDPETGFLYYRYRYYLPSIGRFLTHDPIGNWGDAGNFGNGYASLANAGHQGRDPFGLLSLGYTGAGAIDIGAGGLGGLFFPGPIGGDGGSGGGKDDPPKKTCWVSNTVGKGKSAFHVEFGHKPRVGDKGTVSYTAEDGTVYEGEYEVKGVGDDHTVTITGKSLGQKAPCVRVVVAPGCERSDNYPDTGGYRNVMTFITMIYLIASPVAEILKGV
ncbi:MAG TPA: hypothetical protein ENK02_13640 [Planctomycetes bacterium]|nr:hypothetical protein [Planctomycetota bacterium]